MPSRIDIGPEGGPFVELDEENGEFVIRVPEDEVNFDQSDITNVKDFTAGSVSTETLVIGGTLYEEDANSPINVTSETSHTYNLNESTDHVVVIPVPDSIGFGELRVNGDSTSNYDYIDNADTVTTGQTSWDISQFPENSELISIVARRSDAIKFRGELNRPIAGETIAGENNNVTPPITQFTFSDHSERNLQARVYRRVMDV